MVRTNEPATSSRCVKSRNSVPSYSPIVSILLALLLAITAGVPLGAQAPGHGSNAGKGKAAGAAVKPAMAEAHDVAVSSDEELTEEDLTAIGKIKAEGFNNSQVMDTMSYLTDVYGPRLTNSPNIKEAANWTVNKLKEWGVANVHLEPWGPFGRGWSNERFYAEMTAPRPFELIAYPKAWTPGLGSGPVTAECVLVPLASEEDLAKAQNDFKDRLKGKFVLTAVPQDITPHFEADAHRYTDEDLEKEAQQEIPGPRQPDRFARFRAMRELQDKIQKWLIAEGVAAWIETSPHDDGTVVVQSGGPRDPKEPPSLPRITLAAEHYGRIYRLLQKKIPVTLQIDDENKFYDDDLNSFNIIGEIPGTEKADEIVMIGAHFDSWHPGTGATDNGRCIARCASGCGPGRRKGCWARARTSKSISRTRGTCSSSRSTQNSTPTTTSTMEPEKFAASICKVTKRLGLSSRNG
jgi:carboxypeptidase Q